jgi:hypothetical protein
LETLWIRRGRHLALQKGVFDSEILCEYLGFDLAIPEDFSSQDPVSEATKRAWIGSKNSDRHYRFQKCTYSLSGLSEASWNKKGPVKVSCVPWKFFPEKR